MEYTGLTKKYPVDRVLTEQEQHLRLLRHERLDLDPAHELSVVRMNSSFLEVVDKHYAFKGFMTTAVLAGLALVGWMLADMVWVSIREAGRLANDWPYLLALLALFLPIGLLCIWLLRKESFAYTHYPIRLNRKTRMVHVFRLDGSVLSVPWNEVFFCLGALPQRGWEIQGHVLNADGQTVKETFAFAPHGVGEREREMLKQYWEFVRRYMEDGPQAVASEVKVCLPIAERRETFAFGWHRTHYHVGALPLVMQALMLVLYLVIYPGRWFALRTSRIPKWPADVDDSHGAGMAAARIRSPSATPQELES